MKKLALNKETLRRLDDLDLNGVKGGVDTLAACLTIWGTCEPVTILEPCYVTIPCDTIGCGPGKTRKC